MYFICFQLLLGKFRAHESEARAADDKKKKEREESEARRKSRQEQRRKEEEAEEKKRQEFFSAKTGSPSSPAGVPKVMELTDEEAEKLQRELDVGTWIAYSCLEAFVHEYSYISCLFFGRKKTLLQAPLLVVLQARLQLKPVLMEIRKKEMRRRRKKIPRRKEN